jgi:hypothetical protein
MGEVWLWKGKHKGHGGNEKVGTRPVSVLSPWYHAQETKRGCLELAVLLLQLQVDV